MNASTIAESPSLSALGPMPSAAADEGWRQILQGMLQRDPRHRTKLPELRRQLATLEQRMEEAERRLAASGSGLSVTQVAHLRRH